MSSLSCSFRQNSRKIIGFDPSFGIGAYPPRLRNSGSATAYKWDLRIYHIPNERRTKQTVAAATIMCSNYLEMSVTCVRKAHQCIVHFIQGFSALILSYKKPFKVLALERSFESMISRLNLVTLGEDLSGHILGLSDGFYIELKHLYYFVVSQNLVYFFYSFYSHLCR